MMNDTERRFLSGNLEVRQSGNNAKIVGYALQFNALSENLGGFKEKIDPRALDYADMSDVVALFNHDNNHVLGRVPGTLKLNIDNVGLRYEITPPRHASSIIESIERNDVRGSSFQFILAPGGADWDYDKNLQFDIRTVKKIARLIDCSVVTFPAYRDTRVSISDTTVALRSLADLKDNTPWKVESRKREAQLRKLFPEYTSYERRTKQQWEIDLEHRERVLELLKF